MSKRIITFGIAILLIGGLVGAYLGLEARQEREAALAAEEAAREAEENPRFGVTQLIRQSEMALQRATFEHEDGRTFAFEYRLNEFDNPIWKYAGDHAVVLEQADVRSMMRDVFAFTVTDRLLEETERPEDFGIGRVVITGEFDDGTTEIIRLGGMTPDHSFFYAMLDGRNELFLVNLASGRRMTQDMTDLVDRFFPNVEGMQLRYLYIHERGRQPMEFDWYGHSEEEMFEMLESFGATFLVMRYPFPGRELNLTNLEMRALNSFAGFSAYDLVELFPTNLARYGLNDPSLEFILEDVHGGRIHLILGDMHDDDHYYMMFGDRQHVFLAHRSYVDDLFGLNPFNFIERFVTLVPIVDVDWISIESPGRGSHRIEINNFQDEDERDRIRPIIDGQAVQDQAFRQWYQILIAFTYDVEIGVQEENTLGTPYMTITYHLLERGEGPIVVDFFEYDPNFFAVRERPHSVQFVTSRLAVDTMFNMLPRLLAGELDR